MDSELDRDSADIILETYMNQCQTHPEMGFNKNPETALKLFQFIQMIVKECFDKESQFYKNNVTVGPSDSVYRRIESVSNFIMDIKHENLLKIRSLRDVIEKIKSIMKYLLERVKPFVLEFSDIVTGFKITTPEVYTFSHHVAFTRLGFVLHYLLDILKEEINDLTCWKPTKSFYCNYSPIYVNIEPGQRVVTLKTYDILFIQFLVDPGMKELINTIPSSIKSSKMEDLDWSFNKNECHSTNIRCPLNYIFKTDRTITQLLKVGKYFQKTMGKKEILPENLYCVISMCNGMLICGRRILRDLSFKNVRKLFDIIFSVLDLVYFLTLKTVHCKETMKLISRHCSLIHQAAFQFKEKFIGQEEVRYEDYIDIVYKFIDTIYIPAGYGSFNSHMFKISEIEIVIHRTFLPTEIGGRICNWDNKFSRYKTLEELVKDSETNSCCPVCQKLIDILKPETIAISENCDHLHCVSCVMENVNESMESNSVKRMPNVFQCLHPSCKIFHYDFISADLFDFFRNAVKAFVAAHGRISLPSNWRIKEPCREHGPEYPEECAYWSKISEVDYLKE